MTIMRRCKACEKPIEQDLYLEVILRVLKSDGSEGQDAVEQSYGDYCDECVASAAAVEDLLSDLDYL